jgi:hypothetical protein
VGQQRGQRTRLVNGWAAGSGSQSRQETTTCKGPPGVVQHRRQGHDLGPMPQGEPVLVYRQDGPAAEYGHADLDADLVGPEGGMHAELLSELVRLGRLRCAPGLLQASDVWLDVLEDGQDPTAVLTPGITEARPQVPGHPPLVGRVVGSWYQRTSSGVAGCSQAVSRQAITVGGAEHRIELTQLRMLGGQEVGMPVCSW